MSIPCNCNERQKVIDQIAEIAIKRLGHPAGQSVDLLALWYFDLLRELGAEKESERIYTAYRLGCR